MTTQGNHPVPPPVVPFPELLPFDDPNLSGEQFEAFCEAFISRLPGVRETHRYGRRGSQQKGIDIFADLENGERWAFQCRQWKKFTANDAKKAIEKTTYQANRYILLLCRHATTGVRDACRAYSNWDVWDVGDISRKVRELPLQSGARLIEAHLGSAWRQAFLGIHGLAPFVSAVDYFRPLLNPSALFNHTWDLNGRIEPLRQLHDFVESPQHKAVILVGRGGIGKSKILHAFSEVFGSEHQGLSLWFAAEGVPITQDGADHLPFEPCVVAVDDAHRRTDLEVLTAIARQRPHQTKLLLSCRPQGLEYLRELLTRSGYDTREIVRLPDLRELGRAEVTELARQALGADHGQLAERLAAATWDCPLVTVVGGRLLAEKAIAPELLERHEEFRDTVLSRFRDVLVGQVGDLLDPNLCRSLLDLIAAIQPVRVNEQHVIERGSVFLRIDRPSFLQSLGVLEQFGVLLRRGYSVRIVPDVLADHILHRACITPQGQPTGYADSVFEQFASECPSNVLRNLGELDWRLTISGQQTPALLSSIWQAIQNEFEGASHSSRCTILKILEDMTVFQPQRMLDFLEFGISNPATMPEDPELSKVYEYTHNDVLGELPTLLRRISYTLDFLPRCCDLLWELGRDDNRNVGSYPNHPLRILADLASYEIGKPFAANHGVLDAVERWLDSDPNVHEHGHSPLEIIDPMLAKTGLSSHAQGYQWVLRRFVLKKENIDPVRKRALNVVVRCLSSTDLKVSMRALASLEAALREPGGVLGQQVTDEEREQWQPEQMEILGHIDELAKRYTEPLVHLRIGEALWWHRRYNQSTDIKDKAATISSSIPDSFERRLTRELMDPVHMKDWSPTEGDEDTSYREHQKQMDARQRRLIAEFMEHFQDAGAACGILANRIRTMFDTGVQANPQIFLGALGDSNPAFAAKLCDIIVDDPDGTLGPHLPPLLSNVRRADAERARGISQRALETDSTTLCRSVAMSYQSRGWADDATDRDIEIIRSLLGHADQWVRSYAIGAVGALADSRKRVAIELATGIDIGDDVRLASELCELFGGRWGALFSSLSKNDVKKLLSKLECAKSIDDYHINVFLAKASQHDAQPIVEFLLNRIRRQGTEGSEYDAIPSLGFREPLTGLTKSSDLEQILREIRDAFLEPGWYFEYWVPRLFDEVSSQFASSASLNVLDEWVNSGDADRIKAAASLVAAAPLMFVFSHVRFVSNLLERAHIAGYSCYQSVSSSLASSALSRLRSGTPGQPFPQDVAIRDQATAVAGTLVVGGSPPHKFYVLLARRAEASIKDQVTRGEELFEG